MVCSAAHALAAAAALALATGCGIEVTGPATSSSSGAGGGPGGAGPGGSGSGGGVACWQSTCGADEYCRWEYFTCHGYDDGFNMDFGTCEKIPATCDFLYAPVCGCDGQMYANSCAAAAQGVDIGAETCTPDDTPVGHFPCGPYYCDPVVSYCDHTVGDIGDRWYTCRAWPAGCPAPGSCDCFPPTSMTVCTTEPGNGVVGVMLTYYYW